MWEFVSPLYYEHPIFGTNNMVFRCTRYDAEDARFAGAALDPGDNIDFNAMMPRPLVRSPNSATALGTSYAPGAILRGGH